MTNQGYYRYPTIYKNEVVFVSEDDLWTVSAPKGVARRLTANLGAVSQPALSPNGEWLAFVGCEDGENEVYVMPAMGGAPKRLTYLGSGTTVLGWTPDGEKIIFASNAGQHFFRVTPLYTISLNGGCPEKLPFGPARAVSFGADKGVVLGRRANDLYSWKRYRGGRAGDIWIDQKGHGKFKLLLKNMKHNLANPIWLAERIYFLSDHEGIGNLYSCDLDGEDLKRHTHHEDYYVGYPKTDGRRIVYQAGGDLYILDPTKKGKKANYKIDIQFHSPRTQRQRKFVSAGRYLDHYTIHPEGHSVSFTTRGKAFVMSNWEGAAIQYGELQGVRYRLSEWLNDGKHFVMISDTSGEEEPEAYSTITHQLTGHIKGMDIGRPIFLTVSPTKNELLLSNHRYELLCIDEKIDQTKKARLLDKSKYGRIRYAEWSPDGQWVVYHFPTSANTAAIKLCHVESGQSHYVTTPNHLYDFCPSFDPGGKYIYFLSRRDFDPVSDSHYFDLNFPAATRPYLVTLQQNLPNPFIPLPNGVSPEKPGEEKKDEPEKQEVKPIQIDLEGIEQRLTAFPVSEGHYHQISGLRKGKILFSLFPIESALNKPKSDQEGHGVLEIYDLIEHKKEFIVSGINGFKVSRNKNFLIYRCGRQLRVLKAGEKPDNGSSGYNKKSGWIDLSRAKVAVNPPDEWRQMLREAWRLQRDNFWTEDMSQVDWPKVYERYEALLDRVATRDEFSQLIDEMQAELGTSHTYQFGGDYRYKPNYAQGFLGADFAYDAATDGYRITHIVRGDPWLEEADSPLCRLGVNIKEGDILLAIDGQRLNKELSPQQVLVNQADMEIQLILLDNTPKEPAKEIAVEPTPEAKVEPASPTENQGKSSNENPVAPETASPNENLVTSETATPSENPVVPETLSSNETPPAHTSEVFKTSEVYPTRMVLVKALRNETKARYREWVETNRRYVAEKTNGRVGYLHIPDMGAAGYAEFHRYYLAESEREGLIIDVRFNRGGNVSQLLLEKLARRRLGYDQPRHGEASPYPSHSVLGPLVALINEDTASDGDIFSYAFKAMNLGILIGKRTWGGVIGIWPRHSLVDGTTTTQPEFSLWFEDVGWGIENYGVDPTIEVEIKPQDYAKGKDRQLDCGIAEILKLMEQKPPRLPDFGPRPSLALPKLPK